MLTSLNHFLIFHVFSKSYEEDFFNYLCTFQGVVEQCVVSQIVLLVLEDKSHIAFFQSSDSPNHHDFSMIIESDLTITSASFLCAHGCIPLGPIDLYMLSLFKCSLTCFPCIDSQSSLLQEMDNIGEVHLVKDENPLVPGDCSSGRKRIYMAWGPRRSRGGWENDAVHLKRKIKEVCWCQTDAISNHSRA